MNGVKISDGVPEDAASMSAYPVKGEENEKVSAHEHINLLPEFAGDTMRDTARLAPRCKRPIEHWMYSWQQGEHPTDEQALEVGRQHIKRLVDAHNRDIGKKGRKGAKRIDADEIQAVIAVHRNTDNAHVHVVFNRVSTSGVVLSMYGDRFVSQELCRETELAQGWAHDQGLARVEEIDGKQVVVLDQTVRDINAPAPRLSNSAGKFEALTGERSLERDAVELAAPVVKNAKSWQEIHDGLAPLGMEIVGFGSGLVLRRGEAKIKASAMGGTPFGKGQLEKRLGAFVPSIMAMGEAIGESMAKRERQVLDQAARESIGATAKDAHLGQRWRAFKSEQEATAAGRKVRFAEIAAGQRQALEAERDAYRKRRAELFTTSWKGRGPDLNIRLSLLAGEHARNKARIRREHEEKRQSLQAEIGPAPKRLTWADWIDREATAGDSAARQQQRSRLYIDQRGHAAAERIWGEGEGIILGNGGGQIVKPLATAIERYDSLIRPAKRAVDYLDRESQRVAFTDAGNRVVLHETERRSLIAGLELSAAKWTAGFHITGTEDFKSKALEAAREAGLLHLVKNPELRERITALQADRPWSKSAGESKAAVPADDLRRIWQLDPSSYLRDNGWTSIRGSAETGIVWRHGTDGRELSTKWAEDGNWLFVGRDQHDRPVSGRVPELVQHLQGWPRSRVLGKEREILAPYLEQVKDEPLIEASPAMVELRHRWLRESGEVDRSAYLRNRGLSDVTISMARGELRMDKSGTHMFAHRTSAGDVVGYEMWDGPWSGKFARGGQRHLGVFGERVNPARIVVTSDAVDALSWSQRHNHPPGVMLVSIGTEAGPWTKRDLADLVRRHPGADVVVACRNDALGKGQNKALQDVVEEARLRSSDGGAGGGQGGADKPAASGGNGGVSVAPPPAAVRVPDGRTVAVASWNDLLMVEQGVRISQANAEVAKAKDQEQTLSLGAGQKRTEEMQL